MVVVQLVERLLSTTEICSSYPVIGNFIYYQLYSKLYWNDKNEEQKSPEMAQIFKYSVIFTNIIVYRAQI